jgi:hypothetical protein
MANVNLVYHCRYGGENPEVGSSNNDHFGRSLNTDFEKATEIRLRDPTTNC